MESGRRMSTRSRRATPLPVSPIKQALMANVVAAGKASSKKITRKVLSDKTNATPVAGLVPSKSSKKAAVGQIKEQVSTPCLRRSFQQPAASATPATPVVSGEDLLRSLVHSNLSAESPQADTPQFRAPVPPCQDNQEPEAAPEAHSPSQEAEVQNARPQVEVSSVSDKLSAAWVGHDVNDVLVADDASDSDCSVLVNVSSPGINQHLVASPASATVHPTTPQTDDFKWQRRDSLKVKDQECAFNYYEAEVDDYEECDEYDALEFEQVDCDDIIKGINRIDVAGGLPEHKGRHIRFNYNSDDEVDIEEVDVMRLRGLPTPRGKHLRFPEDKEVSPS